MGGCRCTYRNCTVKSDGKTHMFHYPVFEKIRCHQWLRNAHRLDFLDLKVSQLKNRVVCQHHFKDENFMNFKKDKLTFDAIPTEDGPYCDTNNYKDMDSSKLFTIIIDDIEHDYNDKKANYSLKYGDFLTNLDLMDIVKIDEDSISYKNINNSVDILAHKGRGNSKLINDDFVFNISLPDKSDKKCLTYPTLAVSPYVSSTNVTSNQLQYCEESKLKDNNISTNHTFNKLVSSATGNIEFDIQQQHPQNKKEPKVKIISEKKIINPVAISGNFKPVPPNFVLSVSKRKRKVTSEIINNSTRKYTENIQTCEQDASKELDIEITPLPEEDKVEIKLAPFSSSLNLKQDMIVSEIPLKLSPLKPKVPPERVEAINKKRKFNMKLRDMVESCLDKLDNCDKANEHIIPLESTKTKLNKRRVQHVTRFPKNTSILSSQEYTIGFLEARMKKMQDKLLEKIDQNSKNIIDLKNTFLKTSSENKFFAQTVVDEKVHKKQLFQEISKYLSPNTKSLIYEELFINKFSFNEPKKSPKHKRRRY